MIIDYYVPSERRILAEQKNIANIGPRISARTILMRYLIEKKNEKLYLSCFDVGKGSKEIEISEELCQKISLAKTDAQVNHILMPLKEELLEEAYPTPDNAIDIKNFLLNSKGYIKFENSIVCLFNENSLLINTLSNFRDIQFVISRTDEKSIFLADENNFYKDPKTIEAYLIYKNSDCYVVSCFLCDKIFKINMISGTDDMHYINDFKMNKSIKEMAARILKKKNGISKKISGLLR